MNDLRDLAARAGSLSDSKLFEALRLAVACERAAIEQIDGLTDADELRAVLGRLHATGSHLTAAAQIPGIRKARALATLAPELDPNGSRDFEPGTITDREAYEAAKASGQIEEIPPGDPRATAAPKPPKKSKSHKADPAGGTA